MSRLITACVASFLYFSLTTLGHAYDLSWIGTSGNWSDATNWFSSDAGWLHTEPTADDYVRIANNGTATINSFNESCKGLYLGNASSSGTILMTDGSLTSERDQYIGYGSSGTFIQSAGANTITGYGYYGIVYCTLMVGENATGVYDLSGSGTLSTGHLYVGGMGKFNQTGGTTTVTKNLYIVGDSTHFGVYNLNGSGMLSANNEYVGYYGTSSLAQTSGTNSVADSLFLGYSSNLKGNGTYDLSGSGRLSAQYEYIGHSDIGKFTQSGGVNSITWTLYVGNESGSNGTYNLSGSAQLTSGYEYVGVSGSGTITQTGGTNSASLYLGTGATGIGTYNLSAGQLSGNSELIGLLGTGTFTQTGGTNTIFSSLVIANNEGSVGTYNLDGGTLVASAIRMGSGVATFNFGGGILQASGDLSTSFDMTLTGNGGNATVDTESYDVTLYGNLSGVGGLNKQGIGILDIEGANTYSGNTIVKEGSLILSKSGSLLLDINTAGSSSAILGDGELILNGTLTFDLTDISAAGCWTVIKVDTLTESYATDLNVQFNVSDGIYTAVKHGDGIWMYKIDSFGTAMFIESTGILTVTPIPEPDTLVSIVVGLVGIVVFLFRRRNTHFNPKEYSHGVEI